MKQLFPIAQWNFYSESQLVQHVCFEMRNKSWIHLSTQPIRPNGIIIHIHQSVFTCRVVERRIFARVCVIHRRRLDSILLFFSSVIAEMKVRCEFKNWTRPHGRTSETTFSTAVDICSQSINTIDGQTTRTQYPLVRLKEIFIATKSTNDVEKLQFIHCAQGIDFSFSAFRFLFDSHRIRPLQS